MTTYLWANEDAGGDWDDSESWETLTDPPPQGPPGAGDDVVIHLEVDAAITTDGASCASLADVNHTELDGDLDVTGALTTADLVGGDVTAGQLYGCTFDGDTLSAGTVSGGSQLDAGKMQAGTLIWATINGGTMSANAIEPDNSGDGVIVSGGVVSAQQLLLDNFYAELSIEGGSVTIIDKVTIEPNSASAPGAIFVSNGGRIDLHGGLSLDGGASLGDAGGVVTAPTITVGEATSGRVSINSGGRLTVTSDFVLGEGGDGVLQISDGGRLTVDGDFEAAVSSGSLASWSEVDAGALVIVDGDLELGLAGVLTASVGGGDSGIVTGSIELGVSSGGSATITLSDAGTVLSGGELTLGGEGAAALTLQSGALVAVTSGDLTIAQAEHSKGALAVNDAGSELDVDANATVGEGGAGTLSIMGGAATISGDLTLGENQGASGKLTIADGGLTLAGDTTIGAAGKGSLIVEADGVLAPGSLAIPAGATDTITLGEKLTGKGSLSVTGVGASLTSFGLTVGGAGGGSLSISTKGQVVTTGDATVGETVTADIQKVTVTSGGAWSVGGDLSLGEAAIAVATVTKGGSVRVAGDLTLGEDPGATGTFSLTSSGSGAGATASKLQWGGVLDVGKGGTGNLTIAAGAQATSIAGDAGVVEIGSAKGGSGTITLSGSGSQLSGESVAVGGGQTSAGGAGALIVDSGATGHFTLGGTIWAGGKVSVEGGSLGLGAVVDDGSLNTTGGAVHVTGAFTGTGTVGVGAGGSFTLNAASTKTANRVHVAIADGTYDLVGGSGNDVFVLAIAGLLAQDTISGGAGADTLEFTTAGTIAAAAFAHVSGIDTIRLAKGASSVTLTSALVASSDAQRLTIDGGVGADTVNASAISTGVVVFNGTTTTRTVFTFGAGEAIVTGGAGADLFQASAADLSSKDTIKGGAGRDTLRFTTAGTIAAAALAHVSGVDQIDLANGTNSLTLGDTVVAGADARTLTVVGGTGDDTVIASTVEAGATLVFDGGGGDDAIHGGKGDNVYEFDNVAGALAVSNAYAGGTAAHGSLAFGAGLTNESLWFAKSGANLVIDVIGTSEKVTLNGWYGTNKSAQVSEITAGGLDLDTGLAKLVSAMATFQADDKGFDPSTPGTTMPTNTALQNAIAAAWHH